MNIKSYTLTEILIVLVVLSILASVGIVAWDTTISTSKQRICAQNQILISESLRYYIYENNAVPTSLSMLSPKYTDIALAALKRDKPFEYAKRKVYLACINLTEPKCVCASEFAHFIGSSDPLRCPANKSTGIHYGMIDLLVNSTTSSAAKSFKILSENNVPIIADIDNSGGNTTFSVSNDGNVSGVLYVHKSLTTPSGEAKAVMTSGKGEPLACVKNSKIHEAKLVKDKKDQEDITFSINVGQAMQEIDKIKKTGNPYF